MVSTALSPADPVVSLPLQTWATLRMQLLWIYERRVAEPNRHQPVDTRYGQRAWLLRRGWVKLQTDQGTLQAKAGDWVFLPPAVGEQTFSDDAEILSVAFLCQWPDGANLFAKDAGQVLRASDWPALETVATKLLRGLRRRLPTVDLDLERQVIPFPVYLWLQQAMHAWLEAWTAVQFALGQTLARTLPLDERLALAVRCLNDSAENAELPRQQLLRETGLSLAQLDRLFAKTYGLTVWRYHQGRRVERARHLLDLAELSTKAVGHALGFKHAAHFSLWFKRHTRLTPSAWRKREAPKRVSK
jgi:AraC-like DNA-binding protein